MADVVTMGRKISYGDPSSVGEEKYTVIYDFDEDGGATADEYVLLSANDEDIAVRLIAMRVRTAPTSGGAATLSLGVQSGTEMLNALAIASATGVVNQANAGEFYLVQGDPSTPESIKLKIGTADLTAGVFEFLFGVIRA